MPGRSWVITQTKRDTLVLQVGGLGVGLTTPHSKKLIVTNVEQRKKLDGFNVDGNNRSYTERTNFQVLGVRRL
jgi:hypothetical protein